MGRFGNWRGHPILQVSPGGTWCLALRVGTFQKSDRTVIPEPSNLRAQSCYWTSTPVSGELLGRVKDPWTLGHLGGCSEPWHGQHRVVWWGSCQGQPWPWGSSERKDSL